MSSYTVISDVGNSVIQILRDNLVPDIILNPESIGLCNPEDKGDMVLGVYLYDIKESDMIRESGMMSVGFNTQRNPSTFLTLSFMITVYSNGDVKFRATEEHKILGKVIQTLMDNRMLDPETFKPLESGKNGAIQVEMLNLSQEDKLKIWNVPNKAYRLSVFVKVGPIELSSGKEKEVPRVVSAGFVVKEN